MQGGVGVLVHGPFTGLPCKGPSGCEVACACGSPKSTGCHLYSSTAPTASKRVSPSDRRLRVPSNGLGVKASLSPHCDYSTVVGGVALEGHAARAGCSPEERARLFDKEPGARGSCPGLCHAEGQVLCGDTCCDTCRVYALKYEKPQTSPLVRAFQQGHAFPKTTEQLRLAGRHSSTSYQDYGERAYLVKAHTLLPWEAPAEVKNKSDP